MDPRSSKPDSRPTVAREPGDTNPADGTAAYRPAGADAFLAPPERPDELGWLGPYRILGELGRGGMGVVYRAEDPRLKRQLAIKVLLPQAAGDPQAVARFRREAQAQAKVSHDNVIVIYGVEEANGVTLITMPLLRGQTLAEALRRNPRPPVAEVLRVAREMAEGLAAAHAAGLVHRDIKPANVWLEHPKRRVKILDFGLACGPRGATAAPGARPLAASFDVQLTRAGVVSGTPAYMSPEQAAAREADSRTDLWSLGVVLYQMATGEKPFPGRTSLEVMLAVTQDEPLPAHVRAPDLPPRLSDLIRRLLAKDPADRPPTADAVAAELAAAEQHLAMLSVQVIPFGPLPDTPAAPNPWADIDVTSAETVVAAVPPTRAEPPVRAAARAPSRRWLRPAFGALGAVLLAAAVALVVSAVRPKHKPAEPAAEGPKPPNKSGPGPKAVPVGTIDLLALIDPKRDSVQGRWKTVGGTLVGGGEEVVVPKLELLQVRYAPSAEYDTTLVVERSRTASAGLPANDPAHCFTMMFAGAGRFSLILDANINGNDQPALHGVYMVDGKTYWEYEPKIVGDFFKQGTKVRVECRVRRDSFGVRIDGQERFQCKGDMGRLGGVDDYYGVTDKTVLALGVRYAEYRVHEWTVTPR